MNEVNVVLHLIHSVCDYLFSIVMWRNIWKDHGHTGSCKSVDDMPHEADFFCKLRNKAGFLGGE